MTSAEFPNLVPAMPELFIACVAMVLLVLGVFQKEGAGKTIAFLSTITLALAMLILVAFSQGTVTTFNGLFIADQYSAFAKFLILLGSLLTLVMSQSYLKRVDSNKFEYSILILLSTLGMMMMVSANDLLSLYVGLELQSLSLYILAAFRRDDLKSSEAGVKYFVLGALASGMLLYGSSMIYGFTGTTNFDALAQQFQNADGHVSVGLVVGIVFMLAGLAFKISAVPFHMWTPDVYEGAPTPVTAYFAVAPKIAAVALLMRVMIGPFGELVSQWQQIIVFISIGSMLLGAFAAIAQTNIKRMMAYSSIGHIGFALIGIAVGNQAGVQAVLVYLAIYLFMNVGTFACILCMTRNGESVENISDLAGLGKSNPAMAAVLAIFMFSMAGIPPLAGFFGKLYVFLAAIEAGMFTLAIIGVLASVVGAFYYIRIIKVMYFDESTEAFDAPIGKDMVAILAGTGFVILMFFAYPAPILDSAGAAAASLFAG
ncbi:MAG: NADH-quinone oxidoreductase subunit NuoN [Rhodospirillales bacterium]|nr:NADH-quinone oxidoreductase subunit NuoN [Rhodospirillales bacterium]